MIQTLRKTFTDAGICLPYGAAGEVRTTCPQCSSARRKSRAECLAVNTVDGVWMCHHCGWSGGLRQRDRYAVPPAPRPPAPGETARRTAFRRVWSEAQPINRTDAVARYLTRRGLAGILDDLPTDLRHHRRLAYRHAAGTMTRHHGMLAAVRNPAGAVVTAHRTYLTADGHKASVPSPKRLMPAVEPGATRGGAIRLYPTGETLAVTEGIETALAVHLMTGLAVWAAICAGGMKTLVVPEMVRMVVICADHDDAGVQAANALARRLLSAGKRVKIITPVTVQTDFADILERQELNHATG